MSPSRGWLFVAWSSRPCLCGFIFVLLIALWGSAESGSALHDAQCLVGTHVADEHPECSSLVAAADQVVHSASLAQHRQNTLRKLLHVAPPADSRASQETARQAEASPSKGVHTAMVGLLDEPPRQEMLQIAEAIQKGLSDAVQAKTGLWRGLTASDIKKVLIPVFAVGLVVLVFLLISRAYDARRSRSPPQTPQSQAPRNQALLQQQQSQQPQQGLAQYVHATTPPNRTSNTSDVPAEPKVTAPGKSTLPVPMLPTPLPGRQEGQTQRVSANEPLNMYLCRELVVPPGQECSLIVPRLPAMGRPSGEVTVMDLRSSAVFTAVYSQGAGGGDTDKVLSLHGVGVDNFACGFCRNASRHRPGAPPAFTIHYHPSERQFGLLSADATTAGTSYTLATQQQSWKIRGDARFGSLNAVDAQSRLLATAEADTSTSRRLRVGPHVDASLLTLAVLGVDLLEHQLALQT